MAEMPEVQSVIDNYTMGALQFAVSVAIKCKDEGITLDCYNSRLWLGGLFDDYQAGVSTDYAASNAMARAIEGGVK
jgi:hypothetical protein